MKDRRQVPPGDKTAELVRGYKLLLLRVSSLPEVALKRQVKAAFEANIVGLRSCSGGKTCAGREASMIQGGSEKPDCISSVDGS